jgi:hypothetical protein
MQLHGLGTSLGGSEAIHVKAPCLWVPDLISLGGWNDVIMYLSIYLWVPGHTSCKHWFTQPACQDITSCMSHMQ